MPIDLTHADWLYVVVLAIFVFVANIVANFLSFDRRWIAAAIAALLFVVIFVFWSYYPHGLPLPTSLTREKSTVQTNAPAAPVPAAPRRPQNPVTDITPPAGSSR